MLTVPARPVPTTRAYSRADWNLTVQQNMMVAMTSLMPTLVALAALNASPVTSDTDCRPGVYVGEQVTTVLYKRTGNDGAEELGYQLLDGRRGAVADDEAFVRCQSGIPVAADGSQLERLDLQETDAEFSSGDLTLAGRLIEPADENRERPLVVFVHGSERTGTVGASPYPYAVASQGISVFAYDKRGTGSSEGDYTQNFDALAGDAAAASREARRLAQGRFKRFGLFGGSQGGWVAPLAAKAAAADFVVVGFGLVLTPLEEDAEQVYDEMRRNGYTEPDIAKARDVTEATGTLVASKFTAGFDKLNLVKEKYGSEPWLDEIGGEFTGVVLRASESELRAVGGPEDFTDLEVPWRHDALAVLRTLHKPQLWIIAGEDTVAPGMMTRRRLSSLQCDGLPVTTAVFPDTDHGMFEFVENQDGTRRYTRITEGYFRLITDYMKGEHHPPYGRAEILQAPDGRLDRAEERARLGCTGGSKPLD